MSSIICATRGGEGSRAVQMAAIQRAKASAQRLVFLYVIESARLDEFDETMRPFVRAELYWMAKTLLRIAERRAFDAGIKADLAIREGSIQAELSRIVVDAGATSLLLGAPRSRSADAFGDDAIEQFARTIAESTGIHVEIVRPAADAESSRASLHIGQSK